MAITGLRGFDDVEGSDPKPGLEEVIMPSYVFVWENNTTGLWKISGRAWPGHSSINIGDIFDKRTLAPSTIGSYVSRWPEGDSASITLDRLKEHKGRNSLSICADVLTEGYLPDHIIRLATNNEQEQLMRAEWSSVWMKKGGASYKPFRKNFSTIVARVLHAGGYFRHRWALDMTYAWTPADIAKLAVDEGGERMKWSDLLSVLRNSSITEDDFVNREGNSVRQARSTR